MHLYAHIPDYDFLPKHALCADILLRNYILCIESIHDVYIAHSTYLYIILVKSVVPQLTHVDCCNNTPIADIFHHTGKRYTPTYSIPVSSRTLLK